MVIAFFAYLRSRRAREDFLCARLSLLLLVVFGFRRSLRLSSEATTSEREGAKFDRNSEFSFS